MKQFNSDVKAAVKDVKYMSVCHNEDRGTYGWLVRVPGHSSLFVSNSSVGANRKLSGYVRSWKTARAKRNEIIKLTIAKMFDA